MDEEIELDLLNLEFRLMLLDERLKEISKEAESLLLRVEQLKEEMTND
jgi:hypothetical protein